jgi:hypothetical protein
MILVAVVSLSTLPFVKVPEYRSSTHLSTTVVTAINPEILLDYTISRVSCSSISVCYEQVSPYTFTETWSAQVTHTMTIFSTRTNSVVYILSGSGIIAGLLVLIVLLGGIGLFAKEKLMGSDTILKEGLLVEYYSLAWMLVEAIGAFVAGIFSGSLALLAFGGDSIIELLSSIAVLLHLREESKGKNTEDKTKKTERVTLLLLVSLIPTIGLGAIYAFLTGVQPESSVLGILIAVIAIVIMPVLWFEKRRIGKMSNCLPLTIDATESATCFSMSAALLIGLVANFLWKLWWVDYAATLLILFFLAKEAREAASKLNDRRVYPKLSVENAFRKS